MPTTTIAVLLFPRLTALDAIGPYEALQRLPGTDLVFVGAEVGEVRTENGFLGLRVDATFDQVSAPDVVVVPGGIGTRALMDDAATLAWLRSAHETSRFTTSVCTGSLLLGAAGLLGGATPPTPWAGRGGVAAAGA
ncbi:MAG TPA: DJ-1/PfpI family protein, partial [Microthrixaceae bacterium]|nr:DJ-1/PfpI family protein [Microthrixaceae bacterium]